MSPTIFCFLLICLCHLFTTLDATGGGFFLHTQLFPPHFVMTFDPTRHNAIFSKDKPIFTNLYHDEEHTATKKSETPPHPNCVSSSDMESHNLSSRGSDSTTVKVDDDKNSEQGIPLLMPSSGASNVPANDEVNEVPDEVVTDVPQENNVEENNILDPSRCVWAIISCCSPGSEKVRYPCFELLGCPGPFWDTNPCNKGMIGAAVKVAGDFYSNGKQE